MITKAIFIEPSSKTLSVLRMQSQFIEISEVLEDSHPIGTLTTDDFSPWKHMLWSAPCRSGLIDDISGAFRIPYMFGETVFYNNGLLVAYFPDGSDRVDVAIPLEYIATHIKFLTVDDIDEQLDKESRAYLHGLEF